MNKMFQKIKNLYLFFIDESYFSTRTNFYSTTSMIINFIWATGKFVFGILMRSYFLCVSGGYTFCIGLCKQVYLKGQKKNLDHINQIRYLNFIGIILMIASFFYTIYMSKLFIWPENSRNYGIILSITIATFSFTNLFFAIRGLIKIGGKNDFLLVGLKAVKLATAFSSIVLTQVCLLEACRTATDEINYSFYNAITGTVCGILCVVISILLLVFTNNKKILIERS